MEALGREVQPTPIPCGTTVSLAALLLEFFDRVRQMPEVASELNVAAGILHEELQALLGVYVDSLPSLLS